MRKLYMIILLFCFSLISCSTESILSLFKDNNDKKQDIKEKQYKPDIVWRLNTNAYIEDYPVQEDKYLYFEEYNIEKDIINIAKVNLSSGTFEWKSDMLPFGSTYGGCVTDKYYCFFDYDYYLRILDKKTGSLITTVIMSEDKNERKDYAVYTVSLFFYNNALYWGNATHKTGIISGIMKLDLSRLDYSMKEQIIIPELVYTMQDDEGVFSGRFIIDCETLYGLTYNTKYFRTGYKGSSWLIAFDLNSFDVKWRQQIDCICGFNAEHLKLDGNKLFVLDSGLFCYNKNTGECLFAKNQTDEDIRKEVCLSVPVDQSGIFQYKGKFYYTRNAHVSSNENLGCPEKYNKNIICWDGNTFKLAWADMPPYIEGASLQTRPVVVNGICFVVTNTGLRVYDAETGEFFGVWRDIQNLGWDLNASYENLFVFFDHDPDTGKGILTAINAG